MTTCVTAKSSTGEHIIEELAPGLFNQTGCNGVGAAMSYVWGQEVVEAVLQRLKTKGFSLSKL